MLNIWNFGFTTFLILFGLVSLLPSTMQMPSVVNVANSNIGKTKVFNNVAPNPAEMQPKTQSEKNNYLKRGAIEASKNVSTVDDSTDTETDDLGNIHQSKVSFTPVYVSYAVACLILLAAAGHITYLNKKGPIRHSSVSSNDIPLQSKPTSPAPDSVIASGMQAFRNVEL